MAEATDYDRGVKAGAETMLAYLLTSFAPLTPKQKEFLREWQRARDALKLTKAVS